MNRPSTARYRVVKLRHPGSSKLRTAHCCISRSAKNAIKRNARTPRFQRYTHALLQDYRSEWPLASVSLRSPRHAPISLHYPSLQMHEYTVLFTLFSALTLIRSIPSLLFSVATVYVYYHTALCHSTYTESETTLTVPTVRIVTLSVYSSWNAIPVLSTRHGSQPHPTCVSITGKLQECNPACSPRGICFSGVSTACLLAFSSLTVYRARFLRSPGFRYIGAWGFDVSALYCLGVLMLVQ